MVLVSLSKLQTRIVNVDVSLSFKMNQLHGEIRCYNEGEEM